MRGSRIVVATLLALAMGGCAHMSEHHGGGWTTYDGAALLGWDRIGNANWHLVDGAAVADKGSGFLVTKETHGDFELRAEFYAESDSNSGIHFRCQDPKKLDGNNAATCYEVNIWDDRPKAEHGTAAIVDVAAVVPMPKAGGRWNTLHITAKGDHLVVVFNGVKTVDVHHPKHARGVIGLQHSAGVKNDLSPIKFRKVEIRPL